MGFQLNQGRKFVLCPQGQFIARCYMVVDLGEQPVEWMGQVKEPRQKIRIGFEFPEKLHTFNEEVGPEPFTLSVLFTNSFADKATLKPFLESWRGKAMTPEDIRSFSFDKLLRPPFEPVDKWKGGATGFVTVIHEQKKNETFAKIKSIMPVPEKIGNVKIEVPGPVLKPLLYSVDDGINENFKRLPKWIQDECRRCVAWTHAPETDTGEGGPAAETSESAPPAPDDNTPF